MVFIPAHKNQIVAAFRQNAILRLNVGDDAEIVFNGLPGQVIEGKVVNVAPVIPTGAYYAQWHVTIAEYGVRKQQSASEH